MKILKQRFLENYPAQEEGWAEIVQVESLQKEMYKNESEIEWDDEDH